MDLSQKGGATQTRLGTTDVGYISSNKVTVSQHLNPYRRINGIGTGDSIPALHAWGLSRSFSGVSPSAGA